MASALPSNFPPPAESTELRPKTLSRKTTLDLCSAERDADYSAIAEWFTIWRSKRNWSTRAFAEVIAASQPVSLKKFHNGGLVNLVDIKRMPKRFRQDFLLAFMAWCDSDDQQ